MYVWHPLITYLHQVISNTILKRNINFLTLITLYADAIDNNDISY